ncbi:hypothetical protein [Streptomyces europaeiscabiei]|uniref:hypothetical protein n=1 Tax=Streptomyces europaeiscabiei TaxID=146819 RepID=UPI000765E29B|nr:hypothetical protein [Streptomyces europaeiscabiei]
MTTAPRSPRLLLLSTVVLAFAGLVLLGVPRDQESPAEASSTATAYLPSAAGSAPADDKPTIRTAPTTPSPASAPSVLESALPPHGEGVVGDRAVQRSLEAAWPADLPADEERELLTAGRALLRADATGVGRSAWPDVFADSGEVVAPAFAAARFRIQAAVARRDGGADKAVVHLVWSGMDRGGTFTDLRITDWFFTRSVKKGATTWTPQPRT